MAIMHLSDNDIQAYLDMIHNGLPADTRIVQHLENCKICQEHLTQYSRLYEILAVDKGYELSPGFVDGVVAAAMPESASERVNIWGTILLVAGFCLGLGVTAFFIDLRMLVLRTVESFKLFLLSINDILNYDTWAVVPKHHLDMYLLTGIILLFVSVGDKILFRLKKNHYCL